MSVGYAVRSFGAQFNMTAPSIGRLSPLLHGYGDVGLYNGSGALLYEDGFIGSNTFDGVVSGAVTAPWSTPGVDRSGWSYSDLQTTMVGSISFPGGGYDERSTETFHTKTFEMLQREAGASDRALASGPYVSLGTTLMEDARGSLGLSIKWTSLGAHLSGQANFGHPTRTDFLYTYDRAGFYDFFSSIDVFGLVIDAAKVNDLYEQAFGIPGTFQNPRKSTKRYTVADWSAVGRSDLDVRLNELFLSADVTWKPLPGLEISLSGGPTLNVVETTFTTITRWVNRNGTRVPGSVARHQDSTVTGGAGVQLTARQNLTADGRAYVEAHGGYKWLKDLALRNGTSSSSLDLSDWEVGIGVGLRLDDWPAGSPWTVRGGVDARQLSLGLGAVGTESVRPLFDRSGGRGDVGMADGSHTFVYDDGRVDGAEDFFFTSVGRATLNSESQISSPTADPMVHLHSSSYTDTLTSLNSASREDSQTAVGEYVEFSREMFRSDSLRGSLGFGWHGLSTSLNTRDTHTAVAVVDRTGVVYDYAYLTFFSSGKGLVHRVTVPDPDTLDDINITTVTPFNRTLRYFAITHADVDVSLQSLALAADLAWRPLKRFELAISAGPTLNVASTSATLIRDWVREDGRLYARQQDHESRNQVSLGFRVLASARCDLDQAGHCFAEARGGYEWMPDISLGIAMQQASINATTWTVGGGLGCRLGVKPKTLAIRNVGH